MIDFNKLKMFPGFTVYDRVTGEQVKEVETIDEDGFDMGTHVVSYSTGDQFYLDQEGRLRVFLDINGVDCIVPLCDKYIIQIGSGEMYRW